MKIIAEENFGHWTAWFRETPQVAFGGDNADVAVRRLARAHGIDPDLVIRYSTLSPQKATYSVTDLDCPECRGRGTLGGASVSQPCQRCM